MGLGLIKLEALLRELTATGDVMTYCEAAKKIGLLGEGDRWHPRYLKQISSLLYALAGVESQKGYAAPEAERLNYALIVNKTTGLPGQGLGAKTRAGVAHPSVTTLPPPTGRSLTRRGPEAVQTGAHPSPRPQACQGHTHAEAGSGWCRAFPPG
jgi:hypothetical protein